MDSPGLIEQLRLPNRFIPLWGVIVDDLRQGVRHWSMIWWCALSLLLAVVWFIETPMAAPAESSSFTTVDSFGNATQEFGQTAELSGPRASTIAGKTLRLHLLVWTTLVIALAASSIAGDSDCLASSILCRGLGRWQYFLGKVLARVTLAVVGFVLLTIPVMVISLIKCHNDLTMSGTIAALMKGSMLLALVAAVSVAASSWFRSPLLAVAVAWMGVYGSAIVISLMQVESLSPLGFIETVIALPRRPDAILSATSLLYYFGMTAVVLNILSLIGFSRRDY